MSEKIEEDLELKGVRVTVGMRAGHVTGRVMHHYGIRMHEIAIAGHGSVWAELKVPKPMVAVYIDEETTR